MGNDIEKIFCFVIKFLSYGDKILKLFIYMGKYFEISMFLIVYILNLLFFLEKFVGK